MIYMTHYWKRLVLPSSGPSPYYITILLQSGDNCV